MTVVVNGHGKRVEGSYTFVPEGQRLKFYADFDLDLSTAVNLVALTQGTFDSAAETIEGEGPQVQVPNYVYNAEDPVFFARLAAMGGSAEGLDIRYVGYDIPDETPLCGTPAACAAAGKHNCTGVLGRIPDPEIVILACRGVAGKKNVPMTTTYGTDESDPLYDLADQAYELTESITYLALKDPEAAERDMASYPEGSLAVMATNEQFVAWWMAATVKNYARNNDLEQLFGHLRSSAASLEAVGSWLEMQPVYGQALDQCAEADPDGFVWWADNYNDEAIADFLWKRPAIAAILQRHLEALELIDASMPASEPAVDEVVIDPCPVAGCAHSLALHDPLEGCSLCACAGADEDDDL